MSLGLGIGIDNFWASAGSGGGGGISDTADPSSLAGLIHYWNSQNVGLEGASPERVQTFTQLAAGGSPTTEDHPANRAYYWTEDWVLNAVAVGPNTISPPGGWPFFGTTQALHTGYAESSMHQDVDTPGAKTTAMSGIWTFFIHSDVYFADNRRMMTGSGEQYFEFDGHGNIKLYDSGGSPQYHYPRNNYTAKAWCDAWHVLTWTWYEDGFAFALDGVELTVEGSMAGSVPAPYLTQMPSGPTANLQMTHYIVYDRQHTLADLNSVASAVASDTDISYSYTPLP